MKIPFNLEIAKYNDVYYKGYKLKFWELYNDLLRFRDPNGNIEFADINDPDIYHIIKEDGNKQEDKAGGL